MLSVSNEVFMENLLEDIFAEAYNQSFASEDIGSLTLGFCCSFSYAFFASWKIRFFG